MTVEKRGLFKRLSPEAKPTREQIVSTPVVSTTPSEVPNSETFQDLLPFKNDEKYFSIPEVAKIFNTSESTVYRWVYKGELQGVVVGKKRRVSSSEVRRFSAIYNKPGTKLK